MRTRLTGITFASLAAVPAAVFAAGLHAAPAAAQDKPVALKMAHWVPPSHPLQKAMEDWGNSLKAATNGTVTFAVFPAQQLGKAFDHYDMARDGIADVTYINPGYQPGRFPIIGAGELPFLMTDAKGGSQALDAWYRAYAEKEMKDVKFCLGFVHDPGAIHSRTKKVMVPGDIKGMKVRPAHATMASFITRLGGANVQSSAPEVRDILEKGVADAVTFPWGSVPLFGIDKVTKYHMEVPLYATTFAWVMNKNTYNSMSPAQKAAVDNHCTNAWALRVAAPWADYERAGIQKLKADPAREVYPISTEQLAEWRKAAEPLQAAWADNVRKAGGDADAIFASLKSALAKYNAAY
ncbi:MAG: TRAP transporter substrate-binding protein [Hyphomonadaceae bacterium]|jgi:TRAP-type C4-dicarboxylate transport system substrate-binding protein|nr:TRAP transporter substrate-binding protein [Hyphomonadaceae bacterium]